MKKHGRIKSLLESWVATAREDKAYITRVLAEHKEIHTQAQDASQRAQKILNKFD